MTQKASSTAAPANRPLDPDALRARFPILSSGEGSIPLAYLDNAATTQKPLEVIEALDAFYRRDNANVHRATHALSARATEAYEAARAAVSGFVHAQSESEIVFTRGTTESINLVAHAWGGKHLKAGDEILVSPLEHHSNLVPWQMLARRSGAVLRVLPLDHSTGTLGLSASLSAFGPSTRLLAVTHVSNVLGTLQPVAELCAAARARGVVTLVDAAQSVGHVEVDVRRIGCDFLAFSGHKMYGPTGIGVLYGRGGILESMEPWQGGGEMIETVGWESSTFAPPPQRFEAGTPPIAAAIGLAAAIRFLGETGLEAIADHEHQLATEAAAALRAIPGVTVLGSAGSQRAIVSFTVAGVHAQDVAVFADQRNIALRAGHHCVQPLLRQMGLGPVVRASFACYNTREEGVRLAEAVRDARAFFTPERP